MDDAEELQTLVSELLVRAGMLMEDASVVAVASLPRASADRRRHIGAIALAGATIAALTLATCCLSEVDEATALRPRL